MIPNNGQITFPEYAWAHYLRWVLMETERLLLRPLEEADTGDAMEFWGNESVMKYCKGASKRENIIRSIGFYSELYKNKGLTVFAVVLKENDKVIGACGFNPGKNDDEAELICHFAEAYWGKGFASEAVSACIAAAKTAAITKITASADPKNLASQKVMEKLGFSYKGMKWFEDTQQDEPYYEMKLSRDQIK